MDKNVRIAKELVKLAKYMIASNQSELNRLYNDVDFGYEENPYGYGLGKRYSFKDYTGKIDLTIYNPSDDEYVPFNMEFKNATFDIGYSQLEHSFYIDWIDGVWIDGTWDDGYWMHGYDKLGNEHGQDDSPDKWNK